MRREPFVEVFPLQNCFSWALAFVLQWRSDSCSPTHRKFGILDLYERRRTLSSTRCDMHLGICLQNLNCYVSSALSSGCSRARGACASAYISTPRGLHFDHLTLGSSHVSIISIILSILQPFCESSGSRYRLRSSCVSRVASSL